MLRFRRNKSFASRPIFLLLIYLLAILYFIGRLVHISGQQLYWGIGVLVLWTTVVIAWEVRLLLHCMDWIEFRDEGVCVRHLHRETVYPWNQIKEAECREMAWVLGDRSHSKQVVLSTAELSVAVRKRLCSDVDPWIFRKLLVEFELQGQENEADIRLQLSKRTEWLSTALEDPKFEGITISAKNNCSHISYSSLLLYSFGNCLYSMLRILESALWFLLVIETFDCLTQPIFQTDTLPKGLWIVCLLLSSMRLFWRLCLKFKIRQLSR